MNLFLIYSFQYYNIDHMARNPREAPFYSCWERTKVKCPFCGETISEWYCPYCGIPKNNGSHYIVNDIAHHCGANHFRRGFGNLRDYQLCSKCYAPNPYNANYCKSCGENISSQARDKEGHGWVDLGLSVLWSTKALQECFRWNDIHIVDDDNATELHEKYILTNYGESGGKDAAMHYWGEKWRTPTKDEFEELLTKCTWEKCLITDLTPYALKATGPNGNSIVIKSKKYGRRYMGIAEVPSFRFWTSTSDALNKRRAHSFYFLEWYDDLYIFLDNLLYWGRNRGNNERTDCGLIKERIDYFNNDFLNKKTIKKSLIYKSGIIEYFKEVIVLIKSSRYVGNIPKDKLEKLKNEIWRFIQENRPELWMETPPKILVESNMILMSKAAPKGIYPVADKKWQGRL